MLISPAEVTCPYSFTGNASDEFAAFFIAAYKFAVYAAQVDAEGNNPISGGKPFTFTLSGHHLATGTADGITIRHGEWFADCWGYFVDLLGMLPTARPDGELQIHTHGCSEPLLHLWHD